MRKFLYIFFILIIFCGCKTPAPAPAPVPEVIEIIEPEFEIVSIIIIQADLVNTQFETTLRVKNPNKIDFNLSSIKYSLYGNGMFWADGKEEIDALIPAESSAETKFRFSMNFINMNRKLLDDVIDMRRVRYIFKGEAAVTAAKQAVYNFEFNITGLSDVKPKAE